MGAEGPQVRTERHMWHLEGRRPLDRQVGDRGAQKRGTKVSKGR